MKTITNLTAAGLLLCFLSPLRLQATPLNLTPSLPDFITSSLNVNYVPGSNRFAASGPLTGYQGGSVSLIGSGSYNLNAFINSSGVLTFGFLTLSGDIGSGPETLLTGNLKTGASGTAFGFQDLGGNIFEFLFTVTGGDPTIVSDFGGLNSPNHGVRVNGGNVAFNGTWTGFFANSGASGFADTFAVVPEPKAAFLLLACAGGWLGIRCSQSKYHPGSLGSEVTTIDNISRSEPPSAVGP
jgi:hypothetical protein